MFKWVDVTNAFYIMVGWIFSCCKQPFRFYRQHLIYCAVHKTSMLNKFLLASLLFTFTSGFSIMFGVWSAEYSSQTELNPCTNVNIILLLSFDSAMISWCGGEDDANDNERA